MIGNLRTLHCINPMECTLMEWNEGDVQIQLKKEKTAVLLFTKKN